MGKHRRKSRQTKGRGRSGKATGDASSGMTGRNAPTQQNDGGVPWFVCAGLIVVATVLVYLNSFDGVFVLDDNRQIIENPRVHRLADVGAWLEGRRPVVNFTLAMNYHFGGLNPWGYHLVNLAVHVLAALALFGVVRRTLLLGRFDGAYSRSANGFGLAVALLWAVHPLQTSSVTYVVQRGESMMGLLYLLTLYCLIRRVTSAKSGWSVLAVACCAVGMGTKAVMVTAPFILLVYDRIFVSESFAAIFRKRLGLYLALAATWSILYLVGIGSIFAASTHTRTTAGFSYEGIGPWHYLLTQAGVILHYLRLCFWPVGQCLDYVWRPAEGLEDAAAPGTMIIALLAGTIAAVIFRPRIGFLGVWFFVILAPTSSFIPVKDPAFEHRMYLSLAAVAGAVVFGGYGVIDFFCRRLLKRADAARWISGVCMGAIVLTLGTLSVKRNEVFHSLEAMWRDVLVAAPFNPRAHFGYGRALVQSNRIDEAIPHYEEAIRISPDYAKVYTNLGNALALKGRYEEAAEHHRKAIELKPNLPQAHLNLAGVYVKMQKVEEGIAEYHETLKLWPDSAVTLARLGIILAMEDQSDEAIEKCSRAIELDPDLVEAHYGLAFALWKKGRIDESMQQLRTVLKLDAQHPRAAKMLEQLKAQQAGNRN